MKESTKHLYGTVARTVLAVIGVSGILVVGAVAPNLLQLARPLLRQNHQKPITKKVMDQTLRRLIKRGIVQMVVGPHGWRVALTKRGMEEWFSYACGKRALKRPRRWDKKWRLLIFDIPERRGFLRRKIRRLLLDFGFVRLQDSVWVYPFECQEVLELLRAHHGIRHDALYVRVEHLDKDHRLKEHFKLR